MKHKLSNTSVLLTIAALTYGCSQPSKEKNQAPAPTSALALHTGDEKYIPIDPKESMITWKGSSLMGANGHTGYVYLSKGELMVENGQLKGGAVEVDMNTIEDEKHGRDNGLVRHLKNPDFFDVIKYPFAAISITKVEPQHADSVKVTGDLTIKGITNAVTFPAQIEVKDGLVKANGKLTIDRTKWYVRYKSKKFFDNLTNEAIADSIELNVKIVAKK